MQSIQSRTKHEFAISIAYHQRIIRGLDPPAVAEGLTFCLHYSTAHGIQRDGSDRSRPVMAMSNQDVSRTAWIGVAMNCFQTKHKIHFLHKQVPEEAYEAYYEFESAS